VPSPSQQRCSLFTPSCSTKAAKKPFSDLTRICVTPCPIKTARTISELNQRCRTYRGQYRARIRLALFEKDPRRENFFVKFPFFAQFLPGIVQTLTLQDMLPVSGMILTTGTKAISGFRPLIHERTQAAPDRFPQTAVVRSVLEFGRTGRRHRLLHLLLSFAHASL
jgi:hypothetical protein